ncbi:uncharacterized protein LOC108675669 isoform X2 [Hyalella azteca]|uniref:Uncharacterized protein LOC108675669 isoform X2 n=1 Tax=Hyalella azteca TaxID=294128 RepID=A0A8B7NZQ2_HYAAZ|nr:uncharacterized protein LOC108675669 isoform X2 [Hyalella azteca]
MDELHFHNKPDQTLKGTRFVKRQMIPIVQEAEATSDEIGFPPESFLWKTNLKDTKDFDGHFDSKLFMQTHGHLLPAGDHSAELQKNLRNRRRRIETMSTVDSRVDRGFSSNDEINQRTELHSPYDELTYEETLFEVHDDRIHAKSASSQDDDENALNSMNRSMVSTMNRRKRQKINDVERLGDNFQHAKGSGEEAVAIEQYEHKKEVATHRRNPSTVDGKNRSVDIKRKFEGTVKGARQPQMIPKDLLEQYIEERIKAVEMQIRDEILRDKQSDKRKHHPKGTGGKSLLDKVPEAYSIELEQADESSRDSLLKEIAAVLVSKGYVANIENGIRKDESTELKSRTFGAFERIRSSALENHDIHLPKRRQRQKAVLSPASTYKSHVASSRQPTSLGSEGSSRRRNSGHRSSGIQQQPRRKLRSSCSRSSLTSLIRTPGSSSSSDDCTTRRNKVRRSVSSSKRTSIGSSSHLSLEMNNENDLYDNITFNRKHSSIKPDSARKESDHQKLNEKKYRDRDQKKLKNSSSENSETREIKTLPGDESRLNSSMQLTQKDALENCLASTASQTAPVSGDKENDSSKTEGDEDCTRPAPPPRRKNRTSAALPQPGMSPQAMTSPAPNEGAVLGETQASQKVVRENLVTSRGLTTAYPDHPERDSLDGNLPGSSHGTGNPPPPPAPPQPGPASREAAKLAELNGQSLGLGAGAAKGGKHKKPKKMKGDADDGAGGEDEMRDNLSPLDKKGHASRKLREYPTNSHALTMRDRDYDGPGGYRSWKEPYMYLWTVMSGMYGKLVVLLMFAFCLTEVLENDVAPLTFQGIFLIYLYVGSIFAIICIYTSVIMENCPSMSASKENLTKQGDPEVGSINSFGTLKRAHISRSKTSRTSFYLRIGALVFGLVTLIFNGLEIAMHSTMRDDCAQDVMFAHPIMQALFTFLQMHFLFVNSEVVVEKFGQIARFAFMHLVATNLAIWVRMVVWESANDWIRLNYGSSDLYDMPWHAQKVLHLHTCYHNNTLGRLWTGSQQQFFPFLIEYSLIAAAVTYIMWRNVGKEHIKSFSNLSKAILEETLHEKRGRKGHWKVDCRSASKGLFLGLLVLVGGIVILIIFFVMKDHDGFDEKMFWMVNGSQIIILSLSILSCLIGFWQIPKLAVSSTKPLELDRLLLSCTIVGVYIFAIFGMIVGGLYIDEQKLMTIFCSCCLLVIQVSLQGMLVAEASRRTCSTRLQQLVKPGRQVITFLLFSNITLWILDSFITHSTLSQQFQIGFYGTLAWGIISRISLPLMILFRFHSAVILVEIWKNTYRTKAE